MIKSQINYLAGEEYQVVHEEGAGLLVPLGEVEEAELLVPLGQVEGAELLVLLGERVELPVLLGEAVALPVLLGEVKEGVGLLVPLWEGKQFQEH